MFLFVYYPTMLSKTSNKMQNKAVAAGIFVLFLDFKDNASKMLPLHLIAVADLGDTCFMVFSSKGRWFTSYFFPWTCKDSQVPVS